MRVAVLVSCVFLLALWGLCSGAWATPYMLSDLETDADFVQWVPEGFINHCPDPCTKNASTLAVLTRVASHATQGAYSCQMDLPANESHAGAIRGTWPSRDWSAYNVAALRRRKHLHQRPATQPRSQ